MWKSFEKFKILGFTHVIFSAAEITQNKTIKNIYFFEVYQKELY